MCLFVCCRLYDIPYYNQNAPIIQRGISTTNLNQVICQDAVDKFICKIKPKYNHLMAVPFSSSNTNRLLLLQSNDETRISWDLAMWLVHVFISHSIHSNDIKPFVNIKSFLDEVIYNDYYDSFTNNPQTRDVFWNKIAPIVQQFYPFFECKNELFEGNVGVSHNNAISSAESLVFQCCFGVVQTLFQEIKISHAYIARLEDSLSFHYELVNEFDSRSWHQLSHKELVAELQNSYLNVELSFIQAINDGKYNVNDFYQHLAMFTVSAMKTIIDEFHNKYPHVSYLIFYLPNVANALDNYVFESKWFKINHYIQHGKDINDLQFEISQFVDILLQKNWNDSYQINICNENSGIYDIFKYCLCKHKYYYIFRTKMYSIILMMMKHIKTWETEFEYADWKNYFELWKRHDNKSCFEFKLKNDMKQNIQNCYDELLSCICNVMWKNKTISIANKYLIQHSLAHIKYPLNDQLINCKLVHLIGDTFSAIQQLQASHVVNLSDLNSFDAGILLNLNCYKPTESITIPLAIIHNLCCSGQARDKTSYNNNNRPSKPSVHKTHLTNYNGNRNNQRQRYTSSVPRNDRFSPRGGHNGSFSGGYGHGGYGRGGSHGRGGLQAHQHLLHGGSYGSHGGSHGRGGSYGLQAHQHSGRGGYGSRSPPPRPLTNVIQSQAHQHSGRGGSYASHGGYSGGYRGASYASHGGYGSRSNTPVNIGPPPRPVTNAFGPQTRTHITTPPAHVTNVIGSPNRAHVTTAPPPPPPPAPSQAGNAESKCDIDEQYPWIVAANHSQLYFHQSMNNVNESKTNSSISHNGAPDKTPTSAIPKDIAPITEPSIEPLTAADQEWYNWSKKFTNESGFRRLQFDNAPKKNAGTRRRDSWAEAKRCALHSIDLMSKPHWPNVGHAQQMKQVVFNFGQLFDSKSWFKLSQQQQQQKQQHRVAHIAHTAALRKCLQVLHQMLTLDENLTEHQIAEINDLLFQPSLKMNYAKLYTKWSLAKENWKLNIQNKIVTNIEIFFATSSINSMDTFQEILVYDDIALGFGLLRALGYEWVSLDMKIYECLIINQDKYDNGSNVSQMIKDLSENGLSCENISWLKQYFNTQLLWQLLFQYLINLSIIQVYVFTV